MREVRSRTCRSGEFSSSRIKVYIESKSGKVPRRSAGPTVGGSVLNSCSDSTYVIYHPVNQPYYRAGCTDLVWGHTHIGVHNDLF